MVKNMKYLYMIACLLMFSGTLVLAQDHDAGEEVALYNFLNGSYRLIGKYPDSEKTYSGKVVFKYAQGKLGVVRMINNREIQGLGNLEAATADRIKILRVRFQQDKQRYEATYLIGSDLDNYGRLSGHWYREDGSTKKPGLEALFIDRKAMGQ